MVPSNWFSLFLDAMRWLDYILLPFSWMYGIVLWMRNLLFDLRIKQVEKVDATVISIGNLSVGGTGKSPHVAWLASQLMNNYHVAILSRGYGRKSKGFVKVSATSKAHTVGDEALYYKTRFRNAVEVAVCEKRVVGAKRLLETHPDLDIIILDDAYQHRYLERDINILLTDYHRPFYRDFVLPAGRLREFSSGKNRADMVVMTKCPDRLEASEKKKIIGRMKLKTAIPVYFSSVVYGEMVAFHDQFPFELPEKILLVTGIANPQPLEEYLSKIASVSTVRFKDHHDFTLGEIERIHNLFDTFVEDQKCIVTTSKDYVRLKNGAYEKLMAQYPWFYQEISLQLDNGNTVIEQIKNYVEENK